MENGTKRREWVKNAIIIFLVVMLLLTFFSNTIMNYSLPEVSAQYVRGGTLSEQIRGSGTVEANQSYEVKISETRTIASVDVKVGDEIEKGATLFTLEDKESAELDEAKKNLESEQQKLDDLQLDYDKALLKIGVDYSKENLSIANQEDDIKLAKEDLSKLADYQSAYEKAKNKTKDCETAVKDLDEQLSAFASEDYASLGSSYYNKISSAKTSMEEAEKSKTKTEEKIKEYETDIAAGGNQEAINAAKKAIDDKQLEIEQTTEKMMMSDDYDQQMSYQQTLDRLNLELNHLQEDYNTEAAKSNTYSRNVQLLNAEKTTLDNKTKTYDSKKKSYDDTLVAIKAELKDKQKAAQALYDEAKEEEDALAKKADKTVEEAEDEIRKMERTLAEAKLDLELKQRQDAQTAGENSLDMKDKQSKIADQKKVISDCEEAIKKLEEKSVGAKINAQVGGKITEINVVAGEEAEAQKTVAMIEMSEKGYTLEMTVTTEQAKKVKIGDEAEVQYFWYGDASATLQSITTDSQNPAKNKILKFAVKGDVTPGQNLQLAMGSKGQNYDMIVPNSAIREDNNGKFVLSVVAKSSPLGNRYIAERVDVEILASDDTSSAVSGAVYGSEFIITTSTKPIEAGMQVRLVE
ncbi:MAG: HlyD family efflux transporter periplasmic adaptor subunit [Oscillospiraceae bacterium]|nr:HlyD family efflux transporter periplasmic adaptor subunit [Oscillospiraceae bacterium]